MTPRLDVHVIGGGIGESIVLHLPSREWGVVDCYASSVTDASTNPTIAFLQERGVRHLEFVCLTHPHEDHFRGLKQLLDAFGVRAFWRFGAMTPHDLRLLAKRSHELNMVSVVEPIRRHCIDAEKAQCVHFRMISDSSSGARMTFDGVEVDADAVVGEVGGGQAVLDRALRGGRTGAAAELVGIGSASMDMTVDDLKQRKQFGKLIGEFQALQFRAAHLYSELEIARAATLKAQQLLDEGGEDAEPMGSVAKAKAGRASLLAVQEGVQMHGGIGMTDDI